MTLESTMAREEICFTPKFSYSCDLPKDPGAVPPGVSDLIMENLARRFAKLLGAQNPHYSNLAS